MKKNWDNIMTFFKNMTGSRGEINPDRDWRIVFILAVLVLLGTGVFNGYIFWQVYTGTIFQKEATANINKQTLDVEELTEVLVHLETKRATFNALSENGLNTFDPSR